MVAHSERPASGYWMEVNGLYYPMEGEYDFDDTLKAAGLWREGELYPDFSHGCGPDEFGGGGGPNSGRMGEKLP